MANRTFWNSRRVLVTGHTGFKGGWLTLWLSALGARITGLALPPPTDPNFFTLAVKTPQLTSLTGDIRDLNTVTQAFAQSQPEIVFHLAAQPIVRLSYADPVSTYMTNVMGTLHVLEAARSLPSVKTIIVVTSDKCYEPTEYGHAFQENDPMGGHDPYSGSKGCTELLVAAYRRSYMRPYATKGRDIGLATARAGNVIGGGDWAEDRLIPDIIRATEKKQAVLIRNPTAIRPWQHVLESVSAYLLLAERLWEAPCPHAEGWNFGPASDDAWQVEKVVSCFCDLLGRGAAWKSETSTHAPHETHTLRLDTTKAQARLGWTPRWNLLRGLRETARWYEACLDGKDIHQLSLTQIAEFEASTAP